MKPQMIIIFRLAFLQIFFTCFSFQQLYAQPENTAFRNLTSADGLPTTSVTDVAQDAFGLIWIGSWDFVYRYDGNSFKKITSKEGRYLKADKKGGVWISFEGSVGYYDSYADSVRNYDIPNVNRYPDIGIDNSGKVWVSTTNGIAKFDPGTNLFTKDTGQRSGSVFSLTARGNGELLFQYTDSINKQLLIGRRNSKGTYTYEPFPVDLNNPEKDKLFNAAGWIFLLPIDSTGVLIENKFGWAYKNEKAPGWVFKKSVNQKTLGEITDIKLDDNGNIWLNQIEALSKINIITGKSIIYTHDPRNSNSILFNSSDGGSKIFFDRQGVLWIPRFSQGISRLNLFENDFGLLKDSTGFPIIDVLSALELKDGSFWIGSRIGNEGLMHFGADGKIIKRYGSKSYDSPSGKTISNELSNPYPWSLALSSDGSVWVGTGSPGLHRGGLSRIRPGTNQITRFKNDPGDEASIPGDWVRKILVDGSDRVWIFSSAGLSYIDPITEKISRGIKNQSSDSVDNTHYLPELVTSTGDLIVRTLPEFKHYIINHETLEKKPFGIKTSPELKLFYVHQDEAGKIWFLSPKGFGYLNSSFNAIGYIYEFEKHDFPADEIHALNSDKEGKIWLAANNGIIEFDPATEKYKHFGFERGLQGNYFSGINYKGPSGKIYLGGNGGINIFDPGAIKTNPFPPEMVFTGLKLDGKSITQGEKSTIQKPIVVANIITVGPDVSVISIDFAAIHFAGNKSNKYQYKLDGFDKNWREGGTIGSATYTNLSPGKYTLYIRGSNWDGVWSDGKKSIVIRILPPWWQTWWAYTLYGLIALLLFWRLYQYQKARTIRLEREKAQKRELEQSREIEKAYTELKSTQAQLIQSEKMASLGELTAGIAHEIQNPLNFVNNFSEVNSELIVEMQEELKAGNSNEAIVISNNIKENQQKINHHGKRADAIVKGMLQHSRSSSGVKEPTDINALADEYLRLAYHGLRARDKSFNATMKTDFDASIGNIDIIPQDIGRVILNLITNAFYAVTEKKKLNIEGYEPIVTVSTKTLKPPSTGGGWGLEIRIKDNGNGIPQKLMDKIFQPFFTTKPTGEGTGLGLSLSYDIIKAHGGELKVETKDGEGAEFIIQLPLI